VALACQRERIVNKQGAVEIGVRVLG
jgi:hypothetical protein